MFKLFTAIVLSCAIAMPVSADDLQSPAQQPETITEQTFLNRMIELQFPEVISQACCKMCRKGKACGDSCISRLKQCHKGVGCACDS